MLYALELSSTFQWDLVQEDLLINPEVSSGTATFYGHDKVRPFVIIGTHPYTDLAAKIIHENGSDGTVRVAAGNMNVHGVTIDFSGDPKHLLEPRLTPWKRHASSPKTKRS